MLSAFTSDLGSAVTDTQQHCIPAVQAEKESRAKEAKREVSRIQMEAESRKQQLRAEAEAQKRAAAAAQKEDAARTAQERMQQLQSQWRESEALKQVLPHGCQALSSTVVVL